MDHEDTQMKAKSLVDPQSNSSAPVNINQGFNCDEKADTSSSDASGLTGESTNGFKSIQETNSTEISIHISPSPSKAPNISFTPAPNVISDPPKNSSESVPPASSGPRRKDSISIIWNDLSFEINQKWAFENGYFPRRKDIKKQILKPQNGQIYSGTFTALMGPSGSGKTTLLNCITGRTVTGVTGEISITCPGSKPKANIAFVPQNDKLYMTFTVKETLIFASRMKNLGKNVDHISEVMRVVRNLSLDDCYNLKLSKCSGGELKRVTIGVELISDPDILVLDEPTTGLDSSTAIQCIEMLKRLSELKVKPPAIVATIHQPNYKILQLFTSIYLLSADGSKLYHGPPDDIVDYFAMYKLICPNYTNPADFAMEVAFGDHGKELFKSMEEDNRVEMYKDEGHGTKYEMSKVVFKLREKKMPFFRHTCLLLARNWTHMMRDSAQFWWKNLFAILVALISSHLWSYPIGESDGCWDTINSVVNTTELKHNFFKVNSTVITNEFVKNISRVSDNSAMIFALVVFTMTITIGATVLGFPLEAQTVLKEISNNWYRASSYFISKVLVDAPAILLTNLLVLGIIYPLTGQSTDIWRFLMFYLLLVLMTDVCQSIAVFLGIFMHNDIVASILFGSAIGVPPMVFSGFFVRDSATPWFFQGMSYTSFIKYAFNGIHIVLYGFGRCTFSGTQNVLELFANPTSPRKMAEKVWNNLNVSQTDFKYISSTLKVEEECFASVVNSSMEYIGQDYGQNSTTTPDSSDPSDASYFFRKPIQNPSLVLSYYELTESMILLDMGGLIVFSLICKVAAYLMLRFKTRSII